MTNERPTSTTLSAHDDPELVNVLEFYLAELEANRVPDRATLLAEHPDIAEPLAECLDGLELLHRVVPAKSSTTWPNEDRQLGDYKLLRQLGRGGMGTVFEATSTITGARVAVKVLNQATGLTDVERRRFDHEIHAASSLAHPNIVPIISVGTDRGIPYFAMKYIAGPSLAEMIPRAGGPGKTTARHPATIAEPTNEASHTAEPISQAVPDDPRELVALMLQATKALQYAHSVGIIHRDIKPANLLVDDESNLWVADFGLAFVPGLSRITHSSALVGTLRYMSPEQVEPRRGVVDHRSDLYGLGAAFYEVFTRQAVFRDADRGVLTHKILHEEPTPPRAINPAIPYDLETILLKLLAKDPARRYSSMADLADDLVRFRAGLPILARRTSISDRVLAWVARHRRVVAAGIVGLFALLLFVAWKHQQVREAKAESDATVDTMYTQYAEDVLAKLPRHELPQQLFLQKALEHYERRLREGGNSYTERLARATAWRRYADISHRLGKNQHAVQGYDQAIEILDQEATLGSRRELAIALNDRANIARILQQFDEAATDYTRASSLLTAIHQQNADDLLIAMLLAAVENNRGLLFQSLGHHAEARRCFEAAGRRYAQLALQHPDRKEFVGDAASVRHNFAAVLVSECRYSEAVPNYREALTLRHEAARHDPASPVHRAELARTQMNLADALRRLGERAEAREFAHQSVSLWHQLVVDFPRVYAYQAGLAAATLRLVEVVGTP